uniref:Uncharacterized protein n=1 Tax=Triticum urartu TaxID=4572 RepID=A0A8R7UQZ5_TRIUA
MHGCCIAATQHSAWKFTSFATKYLPAVARIVLSAPMAHYSASTTKTTTTTIEPGLLPIASATLSIRPGFLPAISTKPTGPGLCPASTTAPVRGNKEPSATDATCNVQCLHPSILHHHAIWHLRY